MKTLQTYITEAVNNTAFNIPLDTQEDAMKFFSKYTKYKVTPEIINKLYTEVDNERPAVFVVNGSGGVKIRRYVVNKQWFVDMEEYLDSKYKANATSIKFEGGTPITIGNGSVGKVNTENQEVFTCVLFNDLTNTDYKLQDLNYYIDLSKDYSIDKQWVISSMSQVSAIMDYCNSIKVDIKKLKAIRFDKDSNDQLCKDIVKMYKNSELSMFNDYNSFNPTDIFLYDESVKLTFNYSTIDEIHKALHELHTSGVLIGVSLKKCGKTAHYEQFNMERNVIDFSKYNVNVDRVSCTGKGLYVKFTYDGQEVKLNFRSNNEKSGAFTYEFATTGSKAQDGKCKNFLNDFIYKTYNMRSMKSVDNIEVKYKECKDSCESLPTLDINDPTSVQLTNMAYIIHDLQRNKKLSAFLVESHKMAKKEHDKALPFVKIS